MDYYFAFSRSYSVSMDYYFVFSRSNSVCTIINLFSRDLILFARIINLIWVRVRVRVRECYISSFVEIGQPVPE